MYSKLTKHILSELYKPNICALQKRETIIFKASIEENGEEYGGEMIVYYPGGYLERYGKDKVNGYTAVNMPNKYLAELHNIFREEKTIKANKKLVKGFLNRAFLRAETPGDIPILLPESLHTHFSANLNQTIYNSAPVL